MFIPDQFGHLEPNEFTLYGFTYPTVAHWIVIQTHARFGKEFRHFFDMPAEDLPEIKRFNTSMLDEALEAILPKTLKNKYKYYESMHPVLGIGTTRMRMQFGDPITGKNLYGMSVQRVLKRRSDLK
tara:strand:+ start:164 stop:541 length:378 start_codon:yes stop_codon:yes gene_type:complete